VAGAGPGRVLGTLEAAKSMHMTGAKRGGQASKLAALAPLGDNLTSAVGATRSSRGWSAVSGDTGLMPVRS